MYHGVPYRKEHVFIQAHKDRQQTVMENDQVHIFLSFSEDHCFYLPDCLKQAAKILEVDVNVTAKITTGLTCF